jgi:hypothetical protein
MISDYGELSRNRDGLIAALEAGGIAYRLKKYHGAGEEQHFGGWLDNSGLRDYGETDEEVEKKAAGCAQVRLENMHMFRGRLHRCSNSLFMTELGILISNESDYVDLAGNALTRAQKRDVIRSFYSRPRKSCRYCRWKNGDEPNALRYPAAEQLPREGVSRYDLRHERKSIMKRKKAVLFGGGDFGKNIYLNLKENYNVLCFTDNNITIQNTVIIDDAKCYPPEKLIELDFDKVFICSLKYPNQIRQQLINELHISEDKIDESVTMGLGLVESLKVRNCFLKDFSEICRKNGIGGCVAECGVYRFDFAAEINRCFPDSECYLFDTFEGYAQSDLDAEKEVINFDEKISIDDQSGVDFNNDIQKCPYLEKVHVKKGYFPDTFDLYDKQFVFVNLDMNLYTPTKRALELFYPRMVRGGVLLLHDYRMYCNGIIVAVDEFCKKYGLFIHPIGDTSSVMIIKT